MLQILGVNSVVHNFQPWPYLKVGRRVRIEGGSLDGVEGILVEVKNSLRVVVSIEISHRAVAVEIDRDQITVLPESRIMHSQAG